MTTPTRRPYARQQQQESPPPPHKHPLSLTWRYPILQIRKTDSESRLPPPNTFVTLSLFPSLPCPHHPSLHTPSPHPPHPTTGPPETHSTCTTLPSLYPLSHPPTLPYSSSHDLISHLPHICSIPLHTNRIPSEPYKSAPRHQNTEPPITKFLLCPIFNLQVPAPHGLFKFPAFQSLGPQSPFSQQITAPALPSLESCLVCLHQQTIPHPTFLLSFVLQPHGGHCTTLATFSAIVPPSQEFCFTNTKPFSNCNRRARQQDFRFLSHHTPLICVQHRPNLCDPHHTTQSLPPPPSEIPTTPPLLFIIPLRFPTPTQPLSIPPQPPPIKPTTHKTHTSHPYKPPHTIIHTLRVLLFIFFLLYLAFVIQSHLINT